MAYILLLYTFFACFLKKHSTNSKKAAKYMLNPHQTEQTRSKRVSLWPRKEDEKKQKKCSISPRIHLQTEHLFFSVYVCKARCARYKQARPNPCFNFIHCKVLSACGLNWEYTHRIRNKRQPAHNQFHSIDLTESNFVRDLPARVPLYITIYPFMCVHSDMYHTVSWCCAAVSSTRWDWNF